MCACKQIGPLWQSGKQTLPVFPSIQNACTVPVWSSKNESVYVSSAHLGLINSAATDRFALVLQIANTRDSQKCTWAVKECHHCLCHNSKWPESSSLGQMAYNYSKISRPHCHLWTTHVPVINEEKAACERPSRTALTINTSLPCLPCFVTGRDAVWFNYTYMNGSMIWIWVTQVSRKENLI